MKRIARSGENDWRRFLLAECLEAYADLDEAQKERLQALLTTEQYSVPWLEYRGAAAV